jgi:nucleoside-diphosphate-sugar epimerase
VGRRLIDALQQVAPGRLVAFDTHEDAKESAVAEWVIGSILHPDDLLRAMEGCSVVFHLAALTHAGGSWDAPLSYFELNAMGTAYVLEACRQAGGTRVVYASTGHVYGVPRALPVTEEHPAVPLSPYAASKLAGEIAVEAYATAGLSGCVARVANVYGSDFDSETVIGRALDQATRGGPISLHSLKPVRDFIHIDDVVEALIRLATVGDGEFQVVNVSTGRGISVGAMAETLVEVASGLGLGTMDVQETGEDRADLVPELVLQNERLKELTSWEPQTTLEQGLRMSLQEMLEASS